MESEREATSKGEKVKSEKLNQEKPRGLLQILS